MLGLAAQAQAVKVADVTRILGQRTNAVVGLGLVFGLKGTGDGGDFSPAIKPLQEMLAKFVDKVTVQELNKATNVAVVSLNATIPSTGARQGDHVDVRVTSLGSATSLKGGRLFICPMVGPRPDSGVFALAEGRVELEDPSDSNVGIVHGGAVMEVDLPVMYIEKGKISLILEALPAQLDDRGTDRQDDQRRRKPQWRGDCPGGGCQGSDRGHSAGGVESSG